MLGFPKGFFENEEREGFLVDSTMKTVWAAELEVLAVIADICEKYQLPYFVAWGTLLGAVRHQGFIPWDDDLDICMFREDYEKLMEVLPNELPEGWVIHNPTVDEEWKEYWSCILNANSISISPDRLARFHGCPFIVGIDIFPFDYIPRDEEIADAEHTLFNLIWKAVQLAKIEEPTEKDEEDIATALDVLEDVCHWKFDRTKPIVSQLWTLGNLVCSTYGEKESDMVACYQPYAQNSNRIFNKHWFDDVEYLPFESVYVPVPKDYDAVLTAMYGDYMKPVKGTQSHDYPYFNKQVDMVRDKLREMEEKANQQSGN